jgi:hypothetical protein
MHLQQLVGAIIAIGVVCAAIVLAYYADRWIDRPEE